MITTLLLTTLISAPALTAGEIDWQSAGYEAAAERAREQGKSLLLALVPDWSDYSRKMSEESLRDPAVVALLAEMVCLKFEKEDEEMTEVAQRFHVSNFPTLVIAAPDGSIDDMIIGYFPPAPLIPELQRIASGRDTLRDYLARIAAAPDDLAERYAYAVKLDELGDQPGYRRELATIRSADPEGLTFIGNILMQQDIWDSLAANTPGGEALFDLAPVRAFLATSTQREALFQGWARVANFEAGREARAAAIEAFREADAYAPQNQRLQWVEQVAAFVLQADQGDLSVAAGDYALALAAEAVELAKAQVEPDATGQIGVANPDDFLAQRLDLLVRCQMRWPTQARLESALKTCRRAIQLDPQNADYKARRERLKELLRS